MPLKKRSPKKAAPKRNKPVKKSSPKKSPPRSQIKSKPKQPETPKPKKYVPNPNAKVKDAQFDDSMSKKEIFELCKTEIDPELSRQDFEKIWNYYKTVKEIVICMIEERLKEINASEKPDLFVKRAFEKAVANLRVWRCPIGSGKQAQRIEGVGKYIGSLFDFVFKELPFSRYLQELEKLEL